ncbi:1-acyl-sn-glycerol-3-phosphate acyltransferase [Lysobacter sp. 5GHs7-4]|uniref:lysophospholipid acyltransferase family protein n=1 Tax=Lysobacter sp. 5GHs7-4 TaxID=2904253 RepID=UPI001E4BF809|nr:lysophospholipid acyltransferase family protein [Lysobacter sp. 5GHs7-4]UHQ24027.1 1-acyl-sn-glycerol-3-phosphate acyltransferase [Lysobacter sp. 5GHs7-4]
MLSGWIADGFSFAIRALTGARALWRCPPLGDRRVYYGNHVSHGDFVMIWSALPPALRGETRPVAGADYWQRDALRRYLIREVFNGVLVDREPKPPDCGDPDQRRHEAMQTLCDAVDGGASLILFPEGTRNQGDGLLPFKSGLYHLARLRPELEFVPVWIDNLARVMPKGKLLPLPLLCTATFGEPLRLHSEEGKAAFLARARDALLALSGDGACAPKDAACS